MYSDADDRHMRVIVLLQKSQAAPSPQLAIRTRTADQPSPSQPEAPARPADLPDLMHFDSPLAATSQVPVRSLQSLPH